MCATPSAASPWRFSLDVHWVMSSHTNFYFYSSYDNKRSTLEHFRSALIATHATIFFFSCVTLEWSFPRIQYVGCIDDVVKDLQCVWWLHFCAKNSTKSEFIFLGFEPSLERSNSSFDNFSQSFWTCLGLYPAFTSRCIEIWLSMWRIPSTRFINERKELI